MRTRRFCCRFMERWAPFVAGLGVLGLAGFVGAFLAGAAGLIEAAGYFAVAATSLVAYLAAFTVGWLGDSFEFRRLAPGQVSSRAGLDRVPSGPSEGA